MMIRVALGGIVRRNFLPLFYPQWDLDYGVITLQQSGGQIVTFVVNPFTSLVDIYRDGRDLSWKTFGHVQG